MEALTIIGGIVVILALSGGIPYLWHRARRHYCAVCGRPWDWAHHIHGFGCPNNR